MKGESADMGNPFSLEGKRILVTGASSGIGRACAIQASELGATVLVTGRREQALADTLSHCHGDGHASFGGDITDSVFIGALADRFGKIDGLVHAAGVGEMCPVGQMTREHIESVLRPNYVAFLELMQCYSKRKYRNDNLSVVAISSISALAGWGGIVAYSGSKGAVSSCVRALAMELAPRGIRVNAVCPSNIRTPMYDAVAEANTEESERKIIAKQPLGLGLPNQVACPVCFLLSDAASFITGVNLPVDGGYLAQ